MPRPRTPLREAEATGAIAKNPSRYRGRKSAPKPEGPLGDPPNHFDDVQRDLWHELVGTVPLGVLTSADRILVELTTTLLVKLRDGTIKPVEIGHLRASLGSMGLTPADRTRVKAADGDDQNADPLAVLLGGNGFGHGHTN